MVELDIPGQDGMKLLGENIGCIVAWRKRYISFDSEGICRLESARKESKSTATKRI